jgi:2-(1,2-epoxy-1,2-dihydrophenyl)acetyl-CoA isomerase
MRMSYEGILFEKDDGIATITLNRPDKLNAITPKMRVEMREALEDAAADGSVRAVILTGADRGFCAGADITTVASGSELADDESLRTLHLEPVATNRVAAVLRNLRKPTICALNGIIAGGPIALALSSDIIIASEKARFRIALTRVGLSLENGISYMLARRIGTHLTLELAYTNDIIDAREMERIGLVNRVVPHDELMKTARDMAKRMFDIPPLGLEMAKRCVYKALEASDLESQIAFEMLLGRTLAQTEDRKEAVTSFMEKREPVYKGR